MHRPLFPIVLVVAHNATAGARSAEPEDYRTERSEGGYAAGPERSAPEVATIGRQDGSATYSPDSSASF